MALAYLKNHVVSLCVCIYFSFLKTGSEKLLNLKVFRNYAHVRVTTGVHSVCNSRTPTPTQEAESGDSLDVCSGMFTAVHRLKQNRR